MSLSLSNKSQTQTKLETTKNPSSWDGLPGTRPQGCINQHITQATINSAQLNTHH